ncbi:MAG: ComF family protein [Firmicutes bacterium]|nr:ComF family protein [Bacillota bacterium]
MIKRVLEIGERLLFPNNIYCLVCGAMIDESRPYSLCDKCVRQLHWITGGRQADGKLQRVCAKCGKALPETYRGALCYDCMHHKHAFEKGFSCLTYGLHERELMMNLKYNGRSYIAAKMGEMMFDRMKYELADFNPDGVKIDVVVPVPISRDRLRKRGYNQSELMARYFVRAWDRELGEAPQLETRALLRTKNTQMLRGLDPAERALAMRGAFAVKSTGTEILRDKNVLLIDDIYTTGSTSDACSKALLEAGAQRVYLLTLASGGNRKPGT